MKSPATIILLALCAGHAAAQETPPVLYHVQNDTVGCANPSFTRLLTAAREARRKNPTWRRETMERGRCVAVTPRSPWKLVLLEGDVALMSHAGADGPPGAYYLRVAQVIDAEGHHPGETPAAPAPFAGPVAPQAAAPTEAVPEPAATPTPPVQAEHHGGIIPVVIIAALAVLAAIVVIALQGSTRRRRDPYL
jgi:hypothetical protein